MRSKQLCKFAENMYSTFSPPDYNDVSANFPNNSIEFIRMKFAYDN